MSDSVGANASRTISKLFSISSQILSTLIATSQQQEQVATLGINCRHDMDCSDHIKGSYCSLDSICECSPFYVMFNETTCLPCKCFGLKFIASLDLTRNVFVNRVSEEYLTIRSNIDIPHSFVTQKKTRTRKQTKTWTHHRFFQHNFWAATAWKTSSVRCV